VLIAGQRQVRYDGIRIRNRLESHDMPRMVVDNETSLVSEHYAVIYAPRQDRQRFPENCVETLTHSMRL